MRAVETLSPVNRPQPGFVLFVERRESISIARGTTLTLCFSVGEHDERHGLRELAAVPQKKLLDFVPFGSDDLEGSVDGVDHQDDFNGRIGSRGRSGIDSIKGENVLRLFIVQNREVLLLQPANGRSRFVCHPHIQGDLPVRVACRWN